MTDQLERGLRAAFDHLGDRPPPPGLAENALHRARRARTGRWVGTATGTAGLVAATVFAAAALTGGAAPTVSAAGQIIQGVPGPRIVTAISCQGSGFVQPDTHQHVQRSQVLDRVARRYKTVPYCDVVPSPDGRLAIVSDGDGSAAHPLRRGMLTVHTGAVRWTAGLSIGSWSRAGTRILFNGGHGPGAGGFLLDDATSVDPSRATIEFMPVPDVPNGLGAAGVFTPDGKAIAISVCSCPRGGAHDVTGLRLYDLGGRVLRTLPATGVLTSADAYSPDGRTMALTVPSAAGAPRQLQIADATTGAVRRTVLLAGREFVGWYDADHLVVSQRGHTKDGQGGTLDLKVIDLAGRVKRLPHPPLGVAGADGSNLVMGIGPAAGLTRDPTAQILPF